MADERKIVIELTAKNTLSGGSGDKAGKKDDFDLSNLAHPIKGVSKEVLGAKYILVNQAYNLVKQQVKSIATYEINKYFSLTENYTTQQMMNNALTAIGKVGGFGAAIVSGAILGSGAGPVGAAIGAGLAAVGYAANEGIQIYQKFDQQKRDLGAMNTQSQFQLTRMGLVDGGRSSEN